MTEPYRIVKLCEMPARPHDPATWGPWRLDPATLVVYPVKPYRYEVDLERLTTSAEVLDAIAQVAGKGWPGGSAVVTGFVHALDDVLHLQHNLCSSGRSKRLTRARIRELVAQAVADGQVVLG